jgi:hypothetical protein
VSLKGVHVEQVSEATGLGTARESKALPARRGTPSARRTWLGVLAPAPGGDYVCYGARFPWRSPGADDASALDAALSRFFAAERASELGADFVRVIDVDYGMVFSRIAGSLQLLSITEGNLYAFEPYNRIPTELGRICASATTDSTQMATERFLALALRACRQRLAGLKEFGRLKQAPALTDAERALEPHVESGGSLPTVELLTWEVLPEGEVERVWASTLQASGVSASERKDCQARLRFIRSLRPERWLMGRKLGKRVYVVAEFRDTVLAESPEYGNALYYLSRGNWQSVLSATKQEARAEGAGRIVHAGRWESRVRELVRAR